MTKVIFKWFIGIVFLIIVVMAFFGYVPGVSETNKDLVNLIEQKYPEEKISNIKVSDVLVIESKEISGDVQRVTYTVTKMDGTTTESWGYVKIKSFAFKSTPVLFVVKK